MKDILAAWVLVAAAALVAPADVHAPTTSRQLRFTVTVENPTGEVLREQVVSMYMPVSDAPGQKLTQLKVSHGHRIRRDAESNTILDLTFEEVAPYETQIVTVLATVEMRSEPLPTKLSHRSMYVSPSQYIEVQDPEIRAVAGELRRSDERQTSRAIYDWVRSNLNYAGFVAEDLGARVALQYRRGDCTEYAYLVAALARANDIPARVLGGYVTAADAAPRGAEYHNWTELYINGAWRLVDAQKERFLAGSDEYVTMRISGAHDPAMGNSHRYVVRGQLLVRVN